MLHAELALVCNFMDPSGRIVASSERARIGQTHAIAQRIMQGEMDEYSVSPEEAARSGVMREGMLTAIDLNGQRVTCFTIAGPLLTVRPLARIVRFCVVALLQMRQEQAAASAAREETAAAPGAATPATRLSQLLRDAGQTVGFSLARLHQTIEHVDQGMALLDRELRLVVWNQRFLQFASWPPEQDCQGLPLQTFIAHFVAHHGTDDAATRARVAQRIERLRQGKCNDFEFTTRDGRVLAVADRPLPEGGAVLTYADVTERHHSATALRQAATFFDNSAEGMAITHTDGTIITVNRAFTTITGYEAGEVVGTDLHALESPRHGPHPRTEPEQTLLRRGRWQGEVWNQRKNGEAYPVWLSIVAVRDPQERVTHYVATFSDITQKKQNEERIQQLAFTDPLTRLPNRRLLFDRLEHALVVSGRNRRLGALYFIDIDNFKSLNDTRGHYIGDLLLQQVARRLTDCTGDGDTVGRLGGDEFVVLVEGLEPNPLQAMAQAEAMGSTMLRELGEPYALQGSVHHHSASMGVALFGQAPTSVDELLKHADMAMYRAKASGRNTLCFYDPEMQSALDTRAAMEAAIREALERREFELHYQPQVDHLGTVIGFEALVRWRKGDGSLVAPGAFIPLAEDTGLILPLGRWVLEEACRQLVAWAGQPAYAQLDIAVNVSARQFHQADFADQVLDVLEATGAAPERLKLELTESLLIDDIETVIAKMQTLQASGVGFSLDDFGTGYSSLAYLKRLPLDQLKIDQGFVRDVLVDANDAAIARMVVALADSLGLQVIAEGVETAEQRDFLLQHGCHAYQGYLFSKALPIDALQAWMAGRAQA